MLRLTYDPIFGVQVLFDHQIDECREVLPEDRVGVGLEGSALDEPIVDVTSRVAAAYNRANHAAEGDPHSGD